MKYNKPFDQTDPDAPYVNGNPQIGRRGSIPPAEAFEYPQREIMHVIEAAGMIGTNSDLFQLLKAIKFFGGNIKQGIDVGTKNAVSVVLDPAPNSYDKLFCMVQKMATANDAAMTFTANGLAVKSLKDATGADLSSGALLGSTVFLAMYDGTQMRVLGGTTSYTSISGLTASGGEVIDVSVSAVISVNFDKPTHNTDFHVDDILVRKIHGGGVHVKFTLGELLSWLNGNITFPAGEDPIYLQSGQYKIKRASTTQIGVARKATPTEVANRASSNSDKPYVGPEDLPASGNGVGIGSRVRVPGLFGGFGLPAPIGESITGEKFRMYAAIGGGGIALGPCLDPSSFGPPGAVVAATSWFDSRRLLFQADQTWTVRQVMLWSSSPMLGTGTVDTYALVEFERTA